MPQTTEISTNDREAYTLFIRFLRSSVPQLSADISRRLTARMANAVQEATWQTRMMVPVSKVQCTCSVAAIDDFSPIVEASFQILYRNYPIQFKLSERIPVRSTVTLSIFRKVDWEKLFLALKNDIYAAFRKMTDNMPLFILPIDSLPSDLKELYQHRMRKIGNVTAICTKELVSKYAFYIGGNNCIRIVNWRDNAISLAAKDFRPEKKSWKTKIDPDDKRKLIADPLSFLGFCSLASQTLSKSFPNEAIAAKPVFFNFQSGKFLIRAENNKSLDVSDLFFTKNKYQKSIRGRLEDLLRRFLSGEICPTAEQVEREKIIGELGQSELFLLAYCFRSPTKPLLDLDEILKDSNHCEQISWATETLLATFVPQDGKQIPLLWSNSRNTYTSQVVFYCTQLYKRKLPRLPLEVLDELAEPALKYYFAEKSVNPFDAELRWDALCALERMPAKSILGYSKTKAGEVFFKSFTGDDAIYANYILESAAEDDAS